MSRQITIEQRMYAAGMADTEVDSLKLAKLQRIENAHEVAYTRKHFVFCYVVVICTTTGGTEQIWACVSRYVINPPELPMNDKARNDAHFASTGVWLY